MSGCSICGKPVVGRGWCGLHYGRWQRTGDPQALRRFSTKGENGEKLLCHIAGCSKEVRNKGLCNVHYARLKTRGTTDYVGKLNEGATRHPLYQTWKGVKARGCVPEWLVFAVFSAAVGGARPHYMAHMLRRDYSQPYGPDNWRWAEKKKPTRQPGQWKREATRLYHLKSARRIRDYTLGLRFGISIADYDAMLAEQAGVCAICKRPPTARRRLAVDHCHATGKIRGLLCGLCNQGLGSFKDSKDSLIAATAYLQRGNGDVSPSGLGTVPTLRL